MAEAQNTGNQARDMRPTRLRDALRQARIEAADRTGVVVELRDAEVARLEILNEALDSLFAEVPEQIDLFDRGVSQGETPRLWIDVVARGDGARQAYLPLRAGHPFRSHRDRRVA